MPIYEYRCPDCGHRFDTLQKFDDPPVTECPKCAASSVIKLVSAASFVLKGSGWYRDHYGLKSEGGGESKGGGEGGESKGDAKADAPKGDSAKGDSAKGDAPKADAPKADAPKADAPKPSGGSTSGSAAAS